MRYTSHMDRRCGAACTLIVNHITCIAPTADAFGIGWFRHSNHRSSHICMGAGCSRLHARRLTTQLSILGRPPHLGQPACIVSRCSCCRTRFCLRQHSRTAPDSAFSFHIFLSRAHPPPHHTLRSNLLPRNLCSQPASPRAHRISPNFVRYVAARRGQHRVVAEAAVTRRHNAHG